MRRTMKGKSHSLSWVGPLSQFFQKLIIPKFNCSQTGIEVQYVPASAIDTVAKLRAQNGETAG